MPRAGKNLFVHLSQLSGEPLATKCLRMDAKAALRGFRGECWNESLAVQVADVKKMVKMHAEASPKSTAQSAQAQGDRDVDRDVCLMFNDKLLPKNLNVGLAEACDIQAHSSHLAFLPLEAAAQDLQEDHILDITAVLACELVEIEPRSSCQVVYQPLKGRKCGTCKGSWEEAEFHDEYPRCVITFKCGSSELASLN